MVLKEVTYEEGVRSNPAEYKLARRPEERDTFFEDMHSMSFEELGKKYAAPRTVAFRTKVKRKIKYMIKRLLHIGGRK